MSEKSSDRGPLPLYVAKGSRVYVSGLLSIVIPFYLSTLGYDLAFQGVALTAILAGGALSNIALAYFDTRISRRRMLQGFSLLMVASGVILAETESPLPILIACLVGNISTSGTEAGPFQSVEAGALPELVPATKTVRTFGRYNLIGYTSAAAGTLTSSVPGLFGGNIWAFRALFLGFALAGVLLFGLYQKVRGIDVKGGDKPGLASLGPESRREAGLLSGLFSLDAFGGTFVSQYLLSTFFRVAYGLSLTTLAPVFFVASVITAASTYLAAAIAERIGNLRTMVYTHLTSSAFLIMIPLAGSLVVSVGFLFLRQSFSQMDVPTRQALMAQIFGQRERVAAYAVTNTARTAGAFAGGPVAAGLLTVGTVSGLLYAGGLTKIFYDLAIYSAYRKRFR
ncbi:MAG: MFS transporter [Thaumarchaeota archaeon]|nr:MFS transporter [Nitrososphaerota archaeon]